MFCFTKLKYAKTSKEAIINGVKYNLKVGYFNLSQDNQVLSITMRWSDNKKRKSQTFKINYENVQETINEAYAKYQKESKMYVNLDESFLKNMWKNDEFIKKKTSPLPKEIKEKHKKFWNQPENRKVQITKTFKKTREPIVYLGKTYQLRIGSWIIVNKKIKGVGIRWTDENTFKRISKRFYLSKYSKIEDLILDSEKFYEMKVGVSLTEELNKENK